MFMRNFVVTLNVNNAQDAFKWFMEFLSMQQQAFITSPTLQLVLDKGEQTFTDWGIPIEKELSDEEASKGLRLEPGAGFHVIRYNGTVFWFSRTPSLEPVPTGWQNEPFLFENLSISTLAYNKSHDELYQLFQAAMLHAQVDKHMDHTRIYVPKEWEGWKVAFARNKRPFNSVVLDGDLSTKMLEDAKSFLSSSLWYQRKGIPFRRGYLLYGPPGCGKSSFVVAMAGQLKLDICVLTLSSPELDDNRLNIKLHEAPMNTIILLEDVDAIFLDRNTPLAKGELRHAKGVTFSGLLNAIDGVASQEDGKILFMTTNHIEKLDPALIRPGRCDVKIEFKYASKRQIGTYFHKFYARHANVDELTEQFMSAVPEKSFSITMAALQGHLLENKQNPQRAIDTINKLLTKKQSESDLVPIEFWLTRLGLSKHIAKFRTERVITVTDLKGASSYALTSLGMKTFGERKRVLDMLAGDKDTVREFQLATKQQIEHVYKQYYDEQVERFCELVPNYSVSSLQIRTYLHNHKYHKHSDASAVVDPVTIQIELLETEKKQVEEIKHESIETFLQKLNEKYQWWTDMNEESTDKEKETTYRSLVESLKGDQIYDVSQFCQVSDTDLAEKYGVKKKGRKMKIVRYLKEIKDKIEKEEKALEESK
jgi:chaperone BCS1